MYYLLIMFLIFFQVTLIPQLMSNTIIMDSVLVGIISISVIRGGQEALPLAFVAGMLLSVFSTIHFGFLPLMYVVSAFGSSLLSYDVFRRNISFVILWGGLWCLLFEILVLFAYMLSGIDLNPVHYFLQVVLSRTIINAGLLILCLPLCKWIEHAFYQQQDTIGA